MTGSFSSSQEVTLQQVLLPEFHRTHEITTMKAHIFEANCQYDLILGQDMLSSLGIVINFANKTMLWDHSLAMHQCPLTSAPSLLGHELLLDLLGPDLTFHDNAVFEASEKPHMSTDPKHQDNMYQEVDVDPDGYKAKTICPSKYDAMDLQEVISKCKYLSQQDDLHITISKFPKLFDGQLKDYKGLLIQLDF